MILSGVLPLVILLVAVVCGWWFLLGRGRAGGGRALRLVERMPLDARRAVCVVEVDGRRLLLGLGEGAPTLLVELKEPSPSPAGSDA